MTAVGDYLNELGALLERIKATQRNTISGAGIIVARSIADDRIVHVFGSGHSHMIAEEAFFRAGGLVPVNPILNPRLSFFDGAMQSSMAERDLDYALAILEREEVKEGDAAIVISSSGRNPLPIEMAAALKQRGARLIAITNLHQSQNTTSRHPSGQKLFELAEVVVDTCMPDGDAILTLPGIPFPMGPGSTIAGAAIMNGIMLCAAEELLKQGITPPVFPSANLENTSVKTMEELMAQYSGRVKYFRN